MCVLLLYAVMQIIDILFKIPLYTLFLIYKLVKITINYFLLQIKLGFFLYK